MRTKILAAALAFAWCGAAWGQNAVTPPYWGGLSVETFPFAPTYQLLGTRGGTGATTNGAGTAAGPVLGGSYVFTVVGTFGGASVQLQALGPDGVTWVNVGSAVTTAGSSGVVIGASAAGVTTANVRAVVSGGTSPSLWANLS